jgi:hypothetical protein
MVMREALDGYKGGLQTGGRRVSNLRYADDIVLISTSEQELQDLVNRLERVSSKFDLMINVDKTKVMATDGTICNICIDNLKVEQVHTFPYLGALTTDDAECTKEIRARLSKGQSVGSSLHKTQGTQGMAES